MTCERSVGSLQVQLTRSSKSRVLISISCRIRRTLIHSFSSEDISALVCWISLHAGAQHNCTNAIATHNHHNSQCFCVSGRKEIKNKNLDPLGYKPSGLAALPGVCPFQEQKLRLVEDVHQHRELSVHQWLQTLLQSVNDVLKTEEKTNSGCVSLRFWPDSATGIPAASR